ncbi:hypothetical protein [Pseudomonas sp. TWI929]|uniref:hypothetical protein n=1 Tax=Pseudomonas sp. TWI929 TaxID=3136795 RepID=UPI0032090C53
MSNIELAPIPAEVKQRLDTWKRWWRVFVHAHYLLGIVGVLSSTLAAALPKNYYLFGDSLSAISLCAVISACCFAIIGFVSPDKRYIGLIRAWRALDVSLARYRRGYITEPQLLDALERCETVATEPSRHELPLEKLELYSSRINAAVTQNPSDGLANTKPSVTPP